MAITGKSVTNCHKPANYTLFNTACTLILLVNAPKVCYKAKCCFIALNSHKR